MRPSSFRPFRITDAMILTASLAVGLVLMRACWPRETRFGPQAVRE